MEDRHDTANTEVTRSVAQAAYAAGMRGDMPAFFDCLDDNIVIREPAFLPYGGDYQGKQALPVMFAAVARYIDITTLKLDSLAADGDVAFAVLRAKTADHTGEVIAAERSLVRHGKITDITIFFHELGSLASSVKR